MPMDTPAAADLMRYAIPVGLVLVILILRNRRPRRLRIERLWIYPAVYVVLLIAALASAPPPITPVSLGLLVAGFVIGGLIGWQRGRLMEIHIHPETHDLTSRASALGLVFIFAIFLLRYAGRFLLATDAEALHVPVLAIGDAFLVLAVAMLTVQRLEVWRRASRMLAEAQAAKGAPPPDSLVS